MGIGSPVWGGNPRRAACQRSDPARFVDGCSSSEAATRFGYAPGSFRNLCSQFLRSDDPDFLFPGRPAPAPSSPADDRAATARQRVLALRHDNLSVHDISARLRLENLPASVGFVHKVLHQAGLPKLPRRLPEQRPAVLQAPDGVDSLFISAKIGGLSPH